MHLSPAFKVYDVGLTLPPCASNTIAYSWTAVITQDAEWVPLELFTVIVTFPAPFIITKPSWLTTATFELLDVQIIPSVLVDGVNVATNWNVCLFNSKLSIVSYSLFNLIPVINVSTVTIHVALLLFWVVAVITVVPFFLAVTFPSWSTVDTDVSELFQVNF